jgi:hypothetical protein
LSKLQVLLELGGSRSLLPACPGNLSYQTTNLLEAAYTIRPGAANQVLGEGRSKCPQISNSAFLCVPTLQSPICYDSARGHIILLWRLPPVSCLPFSLADGAFGNGAYQSVLWRSRSKKRLRIRLKINVISYPWRGGASIKSPEQVAGGG